jgi:hypothetical protein
MSSGEDIYHDHRDGGEDLGCYSQDTFEELLTTLIFLR